jgi:hypothetical protein
MQDERLATDDVCRVHLGWLGAFNGLDFFDITVIDGFNMPMDFLPVPGSSGAAGPTLCG